MAGSLLFVSDVLFGDAVAVVMSVLAGLTMLVSWCLAPLRRRRRVLRAALVRDERSPRRGRARAT